VELKTADGPIPLKIFGEHNMKNIMGAKLILDRLGINEAMFYQAIKTFGGAAKRLEKLDENKYTVIYRDFAHAPSKAKATTEATAELFADRSLVACYELHTYSSLNKEFLPHYEDSLNSADTAVVFYSPHTIEMKKMPALSEAEVKAAFGRDDLNVFTDRAALEGFLKSQNWYESNLLLMSSGTFGGMDFKAFSKEILSLPVTKTKRERKGTMLGRFLKKKRK
jgi:UDP-N-acetylmuramate: L-alanyl-gamma-D-glutamyl-meso-diaminopimelate ligase